MYEESKDKVDLHIPETEKCVLAMPHFFCGQLALLRYKVGHHDSLRGGQINHRERARVFQSVPKRAATVIRRARVFDHTLSKAHDVRKTKIL